jgi:hypothetical protein
LQPFGADVAALIAESFVATVIRHRRELEAAARFELGLLAGEDGRHRSPEQVPQAPNRDDR